VTYLTRLTRALYRRARAVHIAALWAAAQAQVDRAHRLRAAADAAQERANAARRLARKANTHADNCWTAAGDEVDLIKGTA